MTTARSSSSPTCSTCAPTTGKYWTGFVFPENVNWPVEQTTYTAAATILAWDVLTGTTPGAGVMTGHEIGVEFDEIALECDCPSPDRFAGVSPGAR